MASSPQPQQSTEQDMPETSATRPDADLKKILISEYIDDQFIRVLVESLKKSGTKGKNILTLKDFVSELSTNVEIDQYNNINKIDLNKVLNTINDEDLNANQNQGIIIIGIELKKAILQAYLKVIEKNISILSILTFWEYIVDLEKHIVTDTLAKEFPYLSKYLSNINIENVDTEVIGRESEVKILTRTLMKPVQNNMILIGDYGIGKTQIVRKLAYTLKKDLNTDPVWANYSVLTVNLNEVIAASKYQDGIFQEFLKEIAKVQNKIFYFPNVDIVPLGKDPMNIEFLFNSFLKDPSNRIIIGINYSSYQNFLSKINIFARQFENVKVEELGMEDLKKIIDLKFKKINKAKQITFEENFFDDLIDFSKRYIQTKALPLKALSLLDEIVVQATIKGLTVVPKDEIKTIIAERTGIPIQTLSAGEKNTLINLEAELDKVIIGQELAVKSVVQSIKRSRIGLKNPNRPTGSFLFLGPTGVGKTELAKQLAKIYFHNEKAFFRFDMSEYAEAHTALKLIGAPPSYTGYEDGGVLTNYVLANPYSLLLFDEIEKANPKIFDLFLQILDDGRLTDSRGQLVDFKNTILIFTSNIGSDILAEESNNPQSTFLADPKKFYNEKILPLLTYFLRIEFINRFDEIIPFLPLDKEKIKKILLLKLEKIRENIKKQGFEIEFDSTDIDKLSEISYDPKFGAREIDRILREYIENPLTEEILKNNVTKGQLIKWKMSNE